MDSCQILQNISILLGSIYVWNLTAINYVDFEIPREKDDFLKITIGHLGLNRGSIILKDVSLTLFYNDQIIIFLLSDKTFVRAGIWTRTCCVMDFDVFSGCHWDSTCFQIENGRIILFPITSAIYTVSLYYKKHLYVLGMKLT